MRIIKKKRVSQFDKTNNNVLKSIYASIPLNNYGNRVRLSQLSKGTYASLRNLTAENFNAILNGKMSALHNEIRYANQNVQIGLSRLNFNITNNNQNYVNRIYAKITEILKHKQKLELALLDMKHHKIAIRALLSQLKRNLNQNQRKLYRNQLNKKRRYVSNYKIPNKINTGVFD